MSVNITVVGGRQATRVNVEDYGAVPDDSGTDNGPIIEALINDIAIGTDDPYEIYFPGRAYYVATTIEMAHYTAIRITGNGASMAGEYNADTYHTTNSGGRGPLSRLVWNGAADANVIEFAGSNLIWDGLAICGSNYKTTAQASWAGVGIYALSSGGTGTSKIQMRNATFTRLDTAIKLGDGTSTEADMLNADYMVFGNVGVGVHFNSGNANDNQIHRTWARNIQTALYKCDVSCDVYINQCQPLGSVGTWVDNSPWEYVDSGSPGYTILELGSLNERLSRICLRGLRIDASVTAALHKWVTMSQAEDVTIIFESPCVSVDTVVQDPVFTAPVIELKGKASLVIRDAHRLRDSMITVDDASGDSADILLDHCRYSDTDPHDIIDSGSDEPSGFVVQNCYDDNGAPIRADHYTTTQIEDNTHHVNTRCKYVGKRIYNTTSLMPLWADGTGINDTWSDGAGTAKHTPSAP